MARGSMRKRSFVKDEASDVPPGWRRDGLDPGWIYSVEMARSAVHAATNRVDGGSSLPGCRIRLSTILDRSRPGRPRLRPPRRWHIELSGMIAQLPSAVARKAVRPSSKGLLLGYARVSKGDDQTQHPAGQGAARRRLPPHLRRGGVWRTLGPARVAPHARSLARRRHRWSSGSSIASHAR